MKRTAQEIKDAKYAVNSIGMGIRMQIDEIEALIEQKKASLIEALEGDGDFTELPDPGVIMNLAIKHKTLDELKWMMGGICWATGDKGFPMYHVVDRLIQRITAAIDQAKASGLKEGHAQIVFDTDEEVRNAFERKEYNPQEDENEES